MATKKKLLKVLVRRDADAHVYSEVRDMNAPEPKQYTGTAIVIDRQRGRMMDSDTVISRAQTLATLLGLPYDEDLTQQCKRDMGWIGTCGCPRCTEKNNTRAARTRSAS